MGCYTGLTQSSSTMSKSANSLEVYRGQSDSLQIGIVRDEEDPNCKCKPSEVAQDLTGATVYFTVRLRIGDTETVIKKTSVNILEIQIQTPATNGIATIYINPEDTSLLNSGTYYFDVWVKLAGGKQYPVIEPSEFIIKEPVTVIG